MTYQQTVLNDKPAGFWMITAASGTSETDLSGNSKTATITEATDLIDRGYRPLVTGTSTDRAYRFYSGNHKLTYPSLEIWDKGRTHIPFSVEFTFQPIVSKRRVDLFVPQESYGAGIGNVNGNGIYIENGILFFSVSNACGSVANTIQSIASVPLSTGSTYHVVAVYTSASISLYVNGELRDSVAVDPALTWSHTTANFITSGASKTADPLVSSFLFDAVSVYRKALPPESVNNHYIFSTPNISDVEIVNKLNDGDRTKSFEYSAKERGWSNNLNVITDLVQNDDGSIGLKKIQPLKVYTTVGNYNNALTWNQASAETDTTGFFQSTGTPTITRSTAQASHGSASVLLTSGAAGVMLASTTIGTSAVPVKPNTQYTFYAEVLLGTVPTGSFAGKISYRFADASGAMISVAIDLASTTTAATWTALSGTVTSPSNAAYAILYFGSNTPSAASQTIYFDKLGIWEGASTNWTPPLFETFTPSKEILFSESNLLDDSVANTNAVSGGYGWTGQNGTTSLVTTKLNAGSLSTVATTATGSAGQIPYGAASFPVTPGQTLNGVAYTMAETTPRTVQFVWYFYDYAGTYLSLVNGGGASTLNSTSVWTKHTGTVVVPPTATSCRIALSFGAGVASEVHYISNAAAYAGSTADFKQPLFNLNELNLKPSRYATVENAGSHLGNSK
jgi:Concanavalin A-like lectin/glucanases superfamily